ncbi:uncharacterized protein AB675_1220 [Cyphellophora attinorum]|uniref:SWIM-type domain-containing protein n=1 Tax=Cyphellophora attinorum TaxID=1664694 RepID=A0A0N1HI66_9EURO|nr:uncharacterized protein AB675_1220 [Phialophora attinorum]KPI35700.1 hypothetical protein AB675_1220 [Phialophora attinorum]
MDFSKNITSLFDALSTLEQPVPDSNERRSFVIPERKPNVLKLLTQPHSSLAKHIFLTLHFLFPHDLLPALDLLDRGLVRCLLYTNTNSDHHPTTEAEAVDNPSAPKKNSAKEVYYIQSASAVTDHPTSINPNQITSSPGTNDFATSRAAPSTSTGRYRNALRPKPTDTFYEVHLDSWNCSCAAFAFNALNLLSIDDGGEGDDDGPSAKLGEPPTESPVGPVEGPVFRFGGTITQPHSPAPVCKHILAACVARSLPEWAWDGSEGWRREVSDREEMAGWGGGWGDR